MDITTKRSPHFTKSQVSEEAGSYTASNIQLKSAKVAVHQIS